MAAADRNNQGTALARRIAYTASKHQPDRGDGHPAVWQPWKTVVAEAAQRMRTELGEGLRQLEAANIEAGQLLDTAAALADETVGRITGAAWAAWHKQMDAAASTAEAILGPAQRAYEEATQRADQRYAQAVETARHTFERTLAKAREAEAIGDQMQAGVK